MSCAEYNFGGKRIQKGEAETCNTCPTTYLSTESYKCKSIQSIFYGKQLIFLISLGFEKNSIYCSRNQICKTSFLWNKHIKNTHLNQECYVMKSKKMPELQGTTESAIIRLIIPDHNISSLATAWSQELNYTHTYSENTPIPLWVYTV